MARGRLISRSLSTSAKRARLHTVAGPLAEFCQALFPLLVAHTDDFGRLAGDAFTVKHLIEPTSPRTEAEFARALQALDAVGLIAWYAVDGCEFIQIHKFDEHQPGLSKRTASKLPEASDGTRVSTKVAPTEEPRKQADNGTPVNFTEIPSELNRTELNRTELEGKGTALVPTVALPFTRPVRSYSRRGLVGDHDGCFKSEACGVGMCVPPWEGAKWMGQYRGDDARATVEIAAFISQQLRNLEPGQDPAKFWKAAWAAHHNAKVPQVVQGKGNATAQAMSRAVQRIMAREEAKGGIS